jgi:pentapeptide MXKDX repeat protein
MMTSEEAMLTSEDGMKSKDALMTHDAMKSDAMKSDAMKKDRMKSDAMKAQDVVMKEEVMAKPENCPPGTTAQTDGTCLLN